MPCSPTWSGGAGGGCWWAARVCTCRPSSTASRSRGASRRFGASSTRSPISPCCTPDWWRSTRWLPPGWSRPTGAGWCGRSRSPSARVGPSPRSVPASMPTLPLPFPVIGLRRPRAVLDARIAQRYDDQLAQGFVEEVRRLAGETRRAVEDRSPGPRLRRDPRPPRERLSARRGPRPCRDPHPAIRPAPRALVPARSTPGLDRSGRRSRRRRSARRRRNGHRVGGSRADAGRLRSSCASPSITDSETTSSSSSRRSTAPSPWTATALVPCATAAGASAPTA